MAVWKYIQCLQSPLVAHSNTQSVRQSRREAFSLFSRKINLERYRKNHTLVIGRDIYNRGIPKYDFIRAISSNKKAFTWTRKGRTIQTRLLSTNDPYQKFRIPHPNNSILFPLFEQERNNCINQIDEYHSRNGGSNVRQEVSNGIQAAALRAQSLSFSSTIEKGPSGQYDYSSTDHHYMRRFVGNSTSSSSSKKEEVVLEYSSNLVGPMSLSMDEVYLSYLCFDPNTNTVGIIVRHISSQTEWKLPLMESLIHAQHSIANVEFGSFGISSSSNPTINTQTIDPEYSLYFTTKNESHRPYSVWHCRFSPSPSTLLSSVSSTSFSEPKCIWKDVNEAHFVDVNRSKAGRFMVINSTAKTSNEVLLIDDMIISSMNDHVQSTPTPKLVMKRENNLHYFVECGDQDDDIYIVAHQMDPLTTYPNSTSYNSSLDAIGPEFSIYQISMMQLPITPNTMGVKLDFQHHNRMDYPNDPHDSTIIEEVDIFQNYIALYERDSTYGTQLIRIVPKKDPSSSYIISIPNDQLGPMPALTPGGNIWYDSTILQFSASSLISPPLSYDCHMDTGALYLRTDQEDRNENSRIVDEQFDQRRVLVTSNDGTQVPLSIVHKKIPTNDNDTHTAILPTLLIGYGSYGISQNGTYDASLIPLLHQGWVIAHAHTRGGGELGKSWYHKGRYEHKERCIEDYISCARALIDPDQLNLTTPGQLVGKGISAGGVMVANAAVIQRPDLFAGVVLQSPFLDVLGTMKKSDLPLTEHEYGEWGDPTSNRDIMEAMIRYCPHWNLGKKDSTNIMPDMLLLGAADDYHVPFWNPLCFVMKAKDVLTDVPNKILLHIEESGGHNFQGKWLEISSIKAAFVMGVVSKNKK